MRNRISLEADHHRQVQAEWSFHSRTYVAQIFDIDPVNGVAQVHVNGVQESRAVTIPMWAFNYNGPSSSWQRYMPEKNAFLKVAYGPRNEVEALGYALWGHDLDPQGGAAHPYIGGYATIRKLADANTNGMAIFRRLQPGEFDLRSSGGAGYYATRTGIMTVEAGPVYYRLDKSTSTARGNAQLHALGGGSSQIRIGDVYRVQSVKTFAESLVLPNPTGAPAAKEWQITVAAPNPLDPTGQTSLSLFDVVAGDVRDATGFPVLQSVTQLPARYRSRAWDAPGLSPTVTVEVDSVGNIALTQSITATGTLPNTGGLRATTQSFGLSARTAGTVAAGTTLDLTGASINVNAAGTANSAMVRGDALNLYLTTKLSVQTPLGPSGPALIPLTPGVELSLTAKVH